MNNQQTLSRRFTVSSSIVLTVILLLVFSGIYLYIQGAMQTQLNNQEMIIEENYQSKGDLLSNLTSKISAELVMSFDMFTLKTIATELLADEDVYKVEILTEKGQALVSEIDTSKQEPSEEATLSITKEIRTDPEKLGIDQLVGTLNLYIDKFRLLEKQEQLKAEAQRTRVFLFSLFLFLTVFVNVLIAVTLNVILRKVVITPIRRGIDLVTSVAEDGDISVSVDEQFTGIVKTEEINSLAEAMQKLVEAEQEIVDLASALAKGDWTQVMHERSEADSLAHAIQSMVSNVNQTLLTVKMMSEQVNEVSQQLSDSGQSLAHGASEQAHNIDTITNAISELAAQTESSANNVKNARQYAIEVNNNAKAGNDQMELLNDAMAHIQESSESIQKIIKTIDDIAFQTNLLALNAAVEAARAGQHGKGFAVVADEVRNLASRSAKAAQETANLIEDSNNKVKNGLHIASQTDESLKEIVAGVGQINASLEEIASASTKEVTDIDSIKTNLLTIENITQQNSATSEETAAMAEELSTQSSSLMEMISAFHLAGNEGSTNRDDEDDYLSPPRLSYN